MKKVLIAAAVALLALAACRKESTGELVGGDATPITLVSSVSQTRSAQVDLQKTQIASGVEVGVFVKGADSYVGDNACYTADGNGNFSGTTLYFPSDGSNVSVNAYAPYNAAFTGKADQAVAFSVAANQSTDALYLASDLLWGTPSGTNAFNKESPVVPLNFSHMLSKITVKFTLGQTDVDLKGATINIVNTLPSTTLKVAEGTLGAATGNPTTIKAVTFTADEATFLASAVIVPQTVAAGSFIQIVLADKMLDAKLDADAVFASGKSYTYNVNISGEGPEVKAEIVLSSTVTDWDAVAEELSGSVSEEELPEPEPITLTATFGTPGGNATYEAPTYTWTGSTGNLMSVFEFSGGELSSYHTLKFTFSNLSEGASVRIGYYVGSDFTEIGNGYYSAGEKTVSLSSLGVDLSTVTKISFGGRNSAGSCDILASDVILIGYADGSGDSGSGSGGSDDSGSDDSGSGGSDSGSGDTLTATFGTPGGNATYQAPTYTWTATNNNLMTCFEFSGGELSSYKTLTFTISNLTSGTMVRMGYYIDSVFTEFGNGYGSNGTKTVDLTALGIDLSSVTKISFGGRTGTGSVDIIASEVILSK